MHRSVLEARRDELSFNMSPSSIPVPNVQVDKDAECGKGAGTDLPIVVFPPLADGLQLESSGLATEEESSSVKNSSLSPCQRPEAEQSPPCKMTENDSMVTHLESSIVNAKAIADSSIARQEVCRNQGKMKIPHKQMKLKLMLL